MHVIFAQLSKALSVNGEKSTGNDRSSETNNFIKLLDYIGIVNNNVSFNLQFEGNMSSTYSIEFSSIFNFTENTEARALFYKAHNAAQIASISPTITL